MRSRLCAAVLVTAMVAFPVQPVRAAGYSFTSIQHPTAPSATWVHGINNLGQIVGYYVTATSGFPFIGSEITPNIIPTIIKNGFVYENGMFTRTLMHGYAEARGINDLATIVGASGFTTGYQAWVNNGDAFTDVAIENAASTILSGIDNVGLMVGSWDEPMTDPPISHGFFGFSASGPFFNLDYPDALTSALRGVNNAGAVVGMYTREPGGPSYGFIYIGGVFASTGPGIEINCINDAFAFGGSFSVGGVNHGFVYANGQATVVDFPGATSTVVSGINNAGTLVGTYRDPSGAHGFMAVLTP